MRAFIALELPEEIKTEIKYLQQQLDQAGVEARWVKPEISHLTLAFLGSITPNKVALISKILEETAAQNKPIKLYLSSINCFPNLAQPRIIFADSAGELDSLHALASKIRKSLKKEKIWFDQKPFAAHLTVGRIKKRKSLTKILKGIAVKRVEFWAKEIALNKSGLDPAGPTYTKLKKVTLA
jgi:2'-5' RNA ligase